MPSEPVPILFQFWFYGMIAFTVLAAWALLVLYRRAISTQMARAGESAPPVPPPQQRQPRAPRPSTASYARARRHLELALALVYGATAFAVALLCVWIRFFTGRTILIQGSIMFIFWENLLGRSTALVATAALFWTIAIPVLSVLLAWRWRTSLVAIVLYQLSWGALVAVIAIARHGRAGWNMLGLLVTVQGFLLGLTAWWPMLLLLLVGHRSLRAVAPIAFASAAAGFTALIGVVLLRAAIFNWPDTPAALLTFLRHSGLNMLLFIAAPLFTAWLVAVSLSRCFGLRRFSDRQLLADFGWLLLILYAFARLGESPNTPAPLIVAGVATFAGYRLIVELGLRVVVGRLRRPPCLNLLLLRTFGFERRMGTLFETVGQWWRFNGNVIMIAGGDLAAPTLDPAQFIRFLGGNLSGQFLRSADDLSTRLTEFSSTPDPDGRYRVNQLYCSASVWQRALVALLERTDIVLMDARGLTAKHQGCVFELQQLAARIDPGRIVLVVDGTTDRTVVDAPFSAAGSPHVITLPNNRASLRSLVRSMETWVEASARAV